MIKTNKDAIYKLLHIVEDFKMLQSGEWVPEPDCNDSCEASIDAVTEVIEYLQRNSSND
jgi:hypothetical protein